MLPLKKILLITVLLCLHFQKIHSQDYIEGDDNDDDTFGELDDIDFDADDEDNEISNSTNSEMDKNELHRNKLISNLKQKELMVRQSVAAAIENNDIRKSIGLILPILRVMTPAQKLALAALVKKQVTDPRANVGYELNDVIAQFARNNKNTSRDLLLPISLDVANLLRKPRHIDANDMPHFQALNASELPKSVSDEENNNSNKTTNNTEEEIIEEIPEAQELRGNLQLQRLRKPAGPFRRNIMDRIHAPPPVKIPQQNRKAIKYSATQEIKDNNCDTLVNGICLETNDYPMETIMIAIRRNKEAMDHLFAEYRDLNETNEIDYTNRRSGSDDDKGMMCSSMVKYARPKKAKATNGKWKFVVNTPEHTQTLRIEKCLHPQGTCSYLTDNFKSQCIQVFNYHRLLTWDKRIGLHMDIFKVPTCCSCHIEGYKAAYPPETHYPQNTAPQEIYPGHDLEHEQADIDPNLIINESQLDAALSFGEPDYHHKSGSINKHTYVRKPPHKSISKQSTIDSFASNSNYGISHYLEAPKPQVSNNPFLNPTSSFTRPPNPIKRGIANSTPVKPPKRNYRRPTQQIHDLEYESSSQNLQTSFPSYAPVSTTTTTTESYEDYDETTPLNVKKYNRNAITKRVNYNYHPIIDFFEPANHRNENDGPQQRMDIHSTVDDMGGWRPVTAPNLVFNARRKQIQ